MSDIFDMPGVAMLVDDGVTRAPMEPVHEYVSPMGELFGDATFLAWMSESMDVIMRELLEKRIVAQFSSASPASLTSAPWRDSVTLLPESVVTWA